MRSDGSPLDLPSRPWRTPSPPRTQHSKTATAAVEEAEPEMGLNCRKPLLDLQEHHCHQMHRQHHHHRHHHRHARWPSPAASKGERGEGSGARERAGGAGDLSGEHRQDRPARRLDRFVPNGAVCLSVMPRQRFRGPPVGKEIKRG